MGCNPRPDGPGCGDSPAFGWHPAKGMSSNGFGVLKHIVHESRAQGALQHLKGQQALVDLCQEVMLP